MIEIDREELRRLAEKDAVQNIGTTAFYARSVLTLLDALASQEKSPGPLRWKFDGGRGAMIDEDRRIVGYYNPHPLDSEKVAAWLQREFGAFLVRDPAYPKRFWGSSADAFCEAYKEGKLT